jgi:hypothetical protein
MRKVNYAQRSIEETVEIGIRQKDRDRSTDAFGRVSESLNEMQSDRLKFAQGCVTTTTVTLESNPKYIKMKLKDLTIKTLAAVTVLGFAFATVSCEKAAETPDEAAKEAGEKAGEAVKEAAKDAGSAAKEAGEAVKEAATEAADAAKSAVNEAAKKVEEATAPTPAPAPQQ